MNTVRSQLRVRAVVLAAVLVVLGCSHVADDREQLLLRADAARLVGAWDVTMVLERPLTQLADSARIGRSVTGSIAFTENRRGAREAEGFGVVTGRGVADLDLHPFSLPFGGGEPEGEVVARTAPVVTPGAKGARDSVSLFVQSADGRVTVRLDGQLAADTIAGVWSAEFLRSDANGRFVMRRGATSQ
jgi:hypothetical protein